MPGKLSLFFEGPFLTLSGYGTHARQILDAILKSGQFDVYANPLNWGGCSWLYNHKHLNIYRQVVNNFTSQPDKKDFDVYVMVSIPNEFQRKGKVNVLVTAGIEADRLKFDWVEGCNRADLVVMPSQFSVASLQRSIAQATDKNTGQTQEIRFTKVVSVVPEGVDLDIYNPSPTEELPLTLTTNFNFLLVGMWGNGSYNEDRKNIASSIRWFCEEFKNEPDVGLVLKINGPSTSKIDKQIVKKKLNEIKANFNNELKCKIYLLHGTLADEQLAQLYKHPKIKALINLGRECWWLPGIEAAACDLPIISVNWGGQLDYLNKGKFSRVEYDEVDVPQVIKNDGFMPENARWANAKEEHFKRVIRKFYQSSEVPKQWALDLGQKIRDKFELELVQKQFLAVLFEFMAKFQSNPFAGQVGYTKFEQELGELTGKNILFVFPQHAGDVFMATGTIEKLKIKYPDYKIYFATNPQYWPILADNPNIERVLTYQDFMTNIKLMEQIFDLVYEPFLHIQMVGANWVQKGTGRNIKDEIAAQCGLLEAGKGYIATEKPEKSLPDKFITFAPGSGKDNWAARNYSEWQSVLDNLTKLFPNEEVKILQIGSNTESLYKGVVDFRGNTFNQDAWLVENAVMHLGIDTFSAHLAGHFNTPSVLLFGSSYPNSTGPKLNQAKETKLHFNLNIKEHNYQDQFFMLEPIIRGECKDNACYVWKCMYE